MLKSYFAIPLLLLFCTSFAYADNNCNYQSFKEDQIRQLRYDEAVDLLKDFYSQFTQAEQDIIRAAWIESRTKTIDYQTQLLNTEFKNFGVNAAQWNSQYHNYENDILNASISKYMNRRSIKSIPESELDVNRMYMGLSVNIYSGSARYPVGVQVTSGQYILNQSSQANTVRSYYVGMNLETGEPKLTFFVAKIDLMNPVTDLKGMNWFDNQLFFQSLEEYIDFQYSQICEN